MINQWMSAEEIQDELFIQEIENLLEEQDPDGLDSQGQSAWNALQEEQVWVPCAQEQWMLDQIDLPTPFDAGTCRCGQFVRAGNLWEHALECAKAREF